MYVHFLKYLLPVFIQVRCIGGVEVKLYVFSGNLTLTCNKKCLIFIGVLN
jgi:hypothetical protein